MWHRVESAVSSTAAEGMLHTAIPKEREREREGQRQTLGKR